MVAMGSAYGTLYGALSGRCRASFDLYNEARTFSWGLYARPGVGVIGDSGGSQLQVEGVVESVWMGWGGQRR